MATYITMLKWTTQGIQNVKTSPDRLDAARKALGSLGIQLKDFYMVTGHYDMIAVVEAPDDQVLAKAALLRSLDGNTISETCRAYTEEEFRSICSSLP